MILTRGGAARREGGWVGVDDNYEDDGYVRQSAAAARGGRERRPGEAEEGLWRNDGVLVPM